MAFGKTVQFRGSDTVLKAYDNRKCVAWSLWAGQQFLFKSYAGSTGDEARKLLEETLEMLDEGESAAIYTLKVYEDSKTIIKEKTECDGSFNFRLQDELPSVRGANYSNTVASQIAALNKKIDDFIADDGDDDREEDESFLGQINKVIEHPLGQKVLGMLNIKIPTAQPGAISGVPEVNQDGKITDAVFILKNKDTRIGEHLTKLAALSEKSPESFNYLIGVLDKMEL